VIVNARSKCHFFSLSDEELTQVDDSVLSKLNFVSVYTCNQLCEVNHNEMWEPCLLSVTMAIMSNSLVPRCGGGEEKVCLVHTVCACA